MLFVSRAVMMLGVREAWVSVKTLDRMRGVRYMVFWCGSCAVAVLYYNTVEKRRNGKMRSTMIEGQR